MLTEKMKTIADDIGGIILHNYDDEYLHLIFSSGLIIEDIIFQVLLECCRYAYLINAEKHPLLYFIERDGLETELARKEIKRTIDYTNKKYDLLDEALKENLGETFLRPDISLSKEKNRYPAYTFSEFQYWESRNIHDMGLVKAVLEKRIPSSKKVSNDRFIELAQEYDLIVNALMDSFGGDSERTVLSSIKFFTLQTKYAFDFYYELAAKMDELSVKTFPDMEYRLMAVSGSYKYNSILPDICPDMASNEDTIIEYPMILQRRRFISEIVTGNKGGQIDDVLASLNEANVVANAVRSHSYIKGKPLPYAIAQETNMDDWASVFQIYNVFRTYVVNKEWTEERIKSVRKMYEMVSIDYKSMRHSENRP